MIDRKKYLTVLIIITCVFCASCGKKRVEYETSFDETASAPDASTDESEVVFDKNININGYTVFIDAKTELPRTKPKVYKAKELKWTEEKKQEIINIVSEGSDGKIYSGKEEDIPKGFRYYELLTEEMHYNSEVANGQGNKYQEYYDDALQRYNDAPDEPVEITDLSSDEYLIKKDNVYCKMDFRGDFSYSVNLNSYFSQKYGYELYQHISLRQRSKYYISEAKDDIDSYVSVACNFVDALNIGEFQPLCCTEMTIAGDYYDENEKQIQSDVLEKAYIITFARSLDGYLIEWRSYDDKKFAGVEEQYDFYTQYYPDEYETIDIMVDSDLNILCTVYLGALEVIAPLKEEVNIINSDKAKQLILDELENNPRYDISQRLENDGVYEYPDNSIINSWDDFSLEYIRIKGENKGEYLIVPAWCLNRKDYMKYKSGVVINALDGSVIYPVDEIYY